jgi:hypothetical protein
MVRERHHAVDFIIIYIREMHPTDEWSFVSNPVSCKQPQNIEQRILLARILEKKGVECPILVDTMLDEAAKKYEALPERLYVLMDNKVLYKGKRGPKGYSLDEVVTVLDRLNSEKHE